MSGVEFDGYANRSGFGVARNAVGGKVGWLGWTLGIAVTLIGVFGPVTLLIIMGGAILVGMTIGAVYRLRQREAAARIAKRPPMEVPHHAQPRPEVHIPRPEIHDPGPPTT